MNIVISGLGVMGASLALAIKHSGLDAVVQGYDKPPILNQAYELQIIDEKIIHWPFDAENADVIFLATPIHIIKKHLLDLNSIVHKNTVITDLGSTKSEIEDYTRKIGFKGTYVGSHPMTGAEKSGLKAANQLLYENAIYILTGNKDNLPKNVSEKLIPVLEAVKARIFVLNADEHDRIMALISHLPQVIAVALMNIVGEKKSNLNYCFDLAAGGFRDLTRIASSSSKIWQDIMLSNKSNIEEAIDGFVEELLYEKKKPLEPLRKILSRNMRYLSARTAG